MDYKEYSKLRSIARKRIERASAAGAMDYVRIPTVKEIRASGNPSLYMQQVRDFLGAPNANLREAKKAGITKIETPSFRTGPEPKKGMTPEAKRARRNEQKRRSKAKRAVEKSSSTKAEANKKVGYLRALETVTEKWKEAGVDVANWLGVLSPGKAKAFVDYMEYRFSQGDYKNVYTIDTFIRDFGTLVQKGYDFKDIQGDFSNFLAKQKKLQGNMRQTKKYGITEDEVDSTWRRFVKEAGS